MGQRVTLGDIARQSNVSLATVSLVLRDKPGINEETRQRVRDVARSLGYRTRAQAEFFLTHNLQQVGLLMKARAGDPPYSNPFLFMHSDSRKTKSNRYLNITMTWL